MDAQEPTHSLSSGEKCTEANLTRPNEHHLDIGEESASTRQSRNQSDRRDRTAKDRTGATLIPWPRGKPLAVDVTISNIRRLVHWRHVDENNSDGCNTNREDALIWSRPTNSCQWQSRSVMPGMNLLSNASQSLEKKSHASDRKCNSSSSGCQFFRHRGNADRI